ncbi:MAG: rhamnan synthesis F family protein [Pseudomonadota bacterium]
MFRTGNRPPVLCSIVPAPIEPPPITPVQALIPAWKAKRELMRLRRQISDPFAPTVGTLNRLAYDYRRPSRVKVFNGAADLEDDVAILLLFQPNGLLNSTIYQIEWLKKCGVSVVVVSNVELSEKDRATLEEKCHLVVERPNVGYDFGGYREGILQLYDRGILPRYLFVMNDSAWLPVQKDCDLISQAREASEDLWGIIMSLDVRPRKRRDFEMEHVQSFFFRFSPALANSRAFKRYWKNAPILNSRRLVIKHFETRMTDHFKRLGYTVGARTNWRDVRRHILALENEQELRAILKQLGASRDREVLSILPELDSGRLSALEVRDRLHDRIQENRAAFYSFAMHPYIMEEFCFPFLKKSRSEEMVAMRTELRRLGMHCEFPEAARAEVEAWDSACS